ncbi:class I SAM-dependent methyltransferase [Ruania alkalisoli]|uniref:Class I SAM-dependent methyltransferase n=1 Tax=Ruania alkalisoli TaxID=2779775 RepID=A0A7M1STA0_9MICO|nr:class I SAM-dependent methyltransferase [Ruania alkalisoli]QOR70799.1 class I SAM-dependent methyltransferase [Ruania alkalisoli]
MTNSAMGTSFGAATTAYEAGRPSYPAAAVDWMLAGAQREVSDIVDVGAGTGKLTAALVGDGRSVTAIDPDEAMLTTLAGNLPEVSTAVGTAESLPMAEASQDAVVLGQAWHWVEPATASAEIARVLRPGGVLGLIWNIRDERTDWVARMSRIIHLSAAEQLISGTGPQIAAPFGEVEQERIEWTRTMDRATIEAMVASRSYYITASDDDRRRIDDGLATLLDELGLTAADATIDFPYVTVAYRATC